MKTYRFDQIAEMISERIDPAEANVERYVGLEHLDPESLHVSRWGHPSDVKGTKLRFYSGDIIFGRRRAYQRKLAVADFEGICSAHAMVLRAKPDVILPDFLPFFMQSELFFERALQISVGSLSPTINWKTLARQEFPLPPLDEQRHIADILWAADEVVEKYRIINYSVSKTQGIYFRKWINSNRHNPNWAKSKLGDVCKIQSGQIDPKVQPYSNMIHIAPDDIEKGTGRLLEIMTAAEDGVTSGKYVFNKNAILYSKIRPNLRKVTFPGFSGVCSADVYPIYPKSEILPEYLFYLLLSDDFTFYAVDHSVRSAIPKIKKALLAYEFTLPPLEDQDGLVKSMTKFAEVKQNYYSYILESLNLKKELLENKFETQI